MMYFDVLQLSTAKIYRINFENVRSFISSKFKKLSTPDILLLNGYICTIFNFKYRLQSLHLTRK